LIPLVHEELRRIARRCMAGERAGHSLQATALVNEAYLRLVDVQRVDRQNRAHFLAMAARLMLRLRDAMRHHPSLYIDAGVTRRANRGVVA
jgi:ECF sigma factor